MQKLDLLADKLAETAAILKVSFAPVKEISGVVPFPLKTEEELDEFENSLTPEPIGFYVSIEQGRLVFAFLCFFFIYIFRQRKYQKLLGANCCQSGSNLS